MRLFYIEDVFFSVNEEENLDQLDHFLSLLGEAGMKMKLKNASSS